jgi:hypothetical protein
VIGCCWWLGGGRTSTQRRRVLWHCSTLAASSGRAWLRLVVVAQGFMVCNTPGGVGWGGDNMRRWGDIVAHCSRASSGRVQLRLLVL